MDEMYQPTTNPSRTWQFRGGTANDGRTYGPPDYAVPYGTKGCPLAPRNYRAELGDIELPPELLEGVFAARLKVADLDLEARGKLWRQLSCLTKTAKNLWHFYINCRCQKAKSRLKAESQHIGSTHCQSARVHVMLSEGTSQPIMWRRFLCPR